MPRRLRETIDADVLDAIRALTEELGFPPTVREIGEQLGTTSMSTVHMSLGRLRRDGRVSWRSGQSRTLVVEAEHERNVG